MPSKVDNRKCKNKNDDDIESSYLLNRKSTKLGIKFIRCMVQIYITNNRKFIGTDNIRSNTEATETDIRLITHSRDHVKHLAYPKT